MFFEYAPFCARVRGIPHVARHADFVGMIAAKHHKDTSKKLKFSL
ncbi:MAG: hypothetical protein RML94_14675 [Bacteroidia bacterium]|nr:hypothetical protein [Bacteroidia bacterium]